MKHVLWMCTSKSRISMAPTLNDIVRMMINDKVTSLAYLMSQTDKEMAAYNHIFFSQNCLNCRHYLPRSKPSMLNIVSK